MSDRPRVISVWLSIIAVAFAALSAGSAPAQPTAGTAPGAGAPRVIIVLDASGSMLAPVGGRPKIEVAREAIADLLKGWDPKVEVGLMAYGHRRKAALRRPLLPAHSTAIALSSISTVTGTMASGTRLKRAGLRLCRIGMSGLSPAIVRPLPNW
jgi:hypothetical protein